MHMTFIKNLDDIILRVNFFKNKIPNLTKKIQISDTPVFTSACALTQMTTSSKPSRLFTTLSRFWTVTLEA